MGACLETVCAHNSRGLCVIKKHLEDGVCVADASTNKEVIMQSGEQEDVFDLPGMLNAAKMGDNEKETIYNMAMFSEKIVKPGEHISTRLIRVPGGWVLERQRVGADTPYFATFLPKPPTTQKSTKEQAKTADKSLI